MKWSILVNVPVDNMNDFLDVFTKSGYLYVCNEYVKGVMCCEESEESED